MLCSWTHKKDVECTQEGTLMLLSVWPCKINTSPFKSALGGRKHSHILKVRSVLGGAYRHDHMTSSTDAAYNQEVCTAYTAIIHVKVCQRW